VYVLDPDILFSLAVTGIFSLSEHKSLESVLQENIANGQRKKLKSAFHAYIFFIKNTIGTTDHEHD